MWRLLDLGAIDGYTMTNLYEAVGVAVSETRSPNTVILNHPEAPFVNIGFHQLMEKEINVDYAREKGFALVRRTLGGGAILDGPWEQDYFVVVRKSSPECPATIPEFYAKFLKPPVRALRSLGLESVIRPPNDILVNGRKISGNGAITIGNANVLAGDLLMETPTDLLSKIIKAPSEKFQDKLADSMSEWLTSISKETGEKSDRVKVKQAIVDGFEEELGIELVPGELSDAEQVHLRELVEARRQPDWIFSKDDDFRSMMDDKVKGTKVRGGVVVSEALHKAGKLVRVILVSEEDVIHGISISGDFFTMPYMGVIKQLESALIGVKLDEESLSQSIAELFQKLGLLTMGASQSDFVEAILKARVDVS